MSNKSHILQIRLDQRQKETLEKVCHMDQISVSEKVRELISAYTVNQHLMEYKFKPSSFDRTIPELQPSVKKRKFTVGEMFSGPGGIGYALSQTKLQSSEYDYSFSHCWATDYDPDTCRTYRFNVLKNEKDAISICADARELDIDTLPVVDGFLYGFPCNDFSLVGETKGIHGKFGGLYKYGIDYINKTNPLFIFAENVSGISSANSGRTFEMILKEMSEAGLFGYNLTVHLFKFEDYGVPQARHRYIVVGIRDDLGLQFQVPKPSFVKRSCKDAIENPPIPKNAHNNEITKQNSVVIERLKNIKQGENVWTANLPEHLQLNVKGAKISQIYKRLDENKPSYTVTGSGGGGTHVYHWSEPRALTNRERARLQTFPDDFVFFGSKESVRKQIGMAVPVDGAKVILDALLKTLAGQTYESVDPSIGYFPATKGNNT